MRSASVLFVHLMKQYGLTFILLLQLNAVRLSFLCLSCIPAVLFVRLMKEHGLTFILLLQLRAVRLSCLCI